MSQLVIAAETCRSYLTIDMSHEKAMKQRWSDPEACIPKPPNGPFQVDQLFPSSAIEDSQKAGEIQAEIGGLLPGRSIVQDHEIGAQFIGQSQHIALSRVKT